MATLEDTLADGTVTMRELQELVLTATESARFIGAYSGSAPAWTTENVFADIGFEPDSFFNSYNLTNKTGRMRRDHPGKSDQEMLRVWQLTGIRDRPSYCFSPNLDQ